MDEFLYLNRSRVSTLRTHPAWGNDAAPASIPQRRLTAIAAAPHARDVRHQCPRELRAAWLRRLGDLSQRPALAAWIGAA